MAEGVDIPYISEQRPSNATLGKDSWKAQWVEEEGRQSTIPGPPSALNIPLAVVSLFCCPILGILALIFAVEARVVYKHGHYLESEALCERSKDTSIYAIAVGIGLGLGLGILLGIGDRFDWF